MERKHSSAILGTPGLERAGAGGETARDPSAGAPFVERVARFLRRKLGPGIQREIAMECRRAFREGRHDRHAPLALPPRYGKHLPERVVELLLARRLYVPGMKVLDVGHANGMECHRAMLDSLPGPRDLTGIDIAEPTYDTSAYYTRSVRASIAETPFDDATFDLIWCISSLEHIGMDNSGYVEGGAGAGATAEDALEEMLRLLRPGGSVLITVPYGRYEDHGWFRNFDEAELQRLLDPVRPFATIQVRYYEHTSEEGWIPSAPHRLRNVGYKDQDNAGAAALAAVVLTLPAAGVLPRQRRAG